MVVMGFSDAEQREIWSVVAAVLHLGNVTFSESGNYAQIEESSGNSMLNLVLVQSNLTPIVHVRYFWNGLCLLL